jgi:hypothetical protein
MSVVGGITTTKEKWEGSNLNQAMESYKRGKFEEYLTILS